MVCGFAGYRGASMMRCELAVSFAGPLVSYQDRGRPGLARYGVPGSGGMDTRALKVANAALGNDLSACGVEVSLGGLQVDCVAGAVSFAVAGGGFQVVLGGVTLGPWTVATLRQGQRLSIRGGAWGSWAMLALAGNVVGKEWLGSMATHAQSGFGAGMIATGARIIVENPEVRDGRAADLALPGWAMPTGRIRVVMGPQERFFDAAVLQRFLGEGFRLSAAYDRMGVRLKGPELLVNSALDMPSEPVLRGSVQVAGDGVATVLLADHQTTGGYPKIATVIGPDLDALVQKRSGDALGFTAISGEEAVLAARQAAAELRDYLAIVSAPRGSLAERLMRTNLISGVFGEG